MYALLFFAFSVCFCWLLFDGWSAQAIRARGWGFSTRIYQRDSEPVFFWVTFIMYMLCAAISIVMCLRLLIVPF